MTTLLQHSLSEPSPAPPPNDPTPRLSIGLPVYNGENYLRESIDSLLSQSFEDFELIISDNASTDATETICREYAQRDFRIRYFRNAENVGAAINFNGLVDLARAPLFKWTAHDDVHAREYLERCVQVMDDNPSIVLCFSKAADLSPTGEILQPHDFNLQVDDELPRVRFHDWIHHLHMCVAVFGVIRIDILKKTALIGSYTASDRTLLAELSLYGRFHEVPETLFFRREHPQRHMRVFEDDRDRLAWFDPKVSRRWHFPAFKRGIESCAAVSRAPLSLHERLRCYMAVMSLIGRKSARKRLWDDITRPTGQIVRRSINKLNHYLR